MRKVLRLLLLVVLMGLTGFLVAVPGQIWRLQQDIRTPYAPGLEGDDEAPEAPR